jgi:hypothetical protein
VKQINFIKIGSNDKITLKIEDCNSYFLSVDNLVISEKEYKAISLIGGANEFVKCANNIILMSFYNYNDFNSADNTLCRENIGKSYSINIEVLSIPNIICLNDKYIKRDRMFRSF